MIVHSRNARSGGVRTQMERSVLILLGLGHLGLNVLDL